jgi:hypothetical protein
MSSSIMERMKRQLIQGQAFKKHVEILEEGVNKRPR